jgi:ATP-dependent DNA helicase DinG
VDKPYGRRIWQALPPMKRTRKLDEAMGFFTPADPEPADSSPPFPGEGERPQAR